MSYPRLVFYLLGFALYSAGWAMVSDHPQHGLWRAAGAVLVAMGNQIWGACLWHAFRFRKKA